MTKLGDKLNRSTPSAAPAETLSLLGAALASGTIAGGMLRDIEPIGKVWVQLIGIREAQRIEGECTAACAKLGLSNDGMAYTVCYEAEKAMRWLCLGVRDPDDKSKPFGTFAEWEAVDPDTLVKIWHAYGDVREILQPDIYAMDEATRVTISGAISKKNGDLLRSFGTNMLVSYMLSMDEQPPTSPISKSLITDSPSES